MQHGPEIKFDLTQELFFLGNGGVKSGIVTLVYTESYIDEGRVINIIMYTIQGFYKYPQEEVFATKEDLIKSL